MIRPRACIAVGHHQVVVVNRYGWHVEWRYRAADDPAKPLELDVPPLSRLAAVGAL